MNFFYENYPESIYVDGKKIRIITDFREYIRLQDALLDRLLTSYERYYIISQYFLDECIVDEKAISELTKFMAMEDGSNTSSSNKKTSKQLYSYSFDFPYILSAFIQVYGINLQTIPYMHWWKFQTLFNGLPQDTEIKQRIMYRGINLSDIKDREERKRIRKIQLAIRLPTQVEISDYEIGDAFV